MRYFFRICLACVLVGGGTGLGIYVANDALRLMESDTPSESVGTASNGSLRHGKRLPSSGPNFQTYSRFGSALGRTSVHSTVRDVVVDAYGALSDAHPELRFVYGEAGWPSGGPFRPHKTHQNGLAIDFMVPVRTAEFRGVQLPTSPLNLWGYRLEFDERGQLGRLSIDWSAMTAHLLALREAAEQRGARIDLVIFDPTLRRLLLASESGKDLVGKVRFSKASAWVRHDEHYHVLFAL